MTEVAYNKPRAIPVVVSGALAVTAVVWCCLFVWSPDTWGCNLLFFGNAEGCFFNDYFMTSAVARMPVPYIDDCCSGWLDYQWVRRSEQCYPALAHYWVGLFPENLLGAVSCTLLGVAIYIWSLIVFFRKLIPGKVLMATSVACCSAPFLFAFGVGNLIFYAAGFSLLFLTWYDSASTWRRCVAAVALALASVLKISPALLWLLYLRKGDLSRLRYAGLSALIALLLFIVPFCCCGGRDAVHLWIENASMNSLVHARETLFGILGFVSNLMSSLGMGGLTGFAWYALRIASSCVGLIVLIIGCRFGSGLWDRGCAAVIGMLFTPPTMLYYTALYIIPFAIVGMYHGNDRINRISGLFCLSLCMTLRMPLLLGSANVCVAAAGSVDLAVALAMLIIRNRGRRHADG